MIPTIGFMVGCYINFRAVELICRNGEYFNSRGGRNVMLILAVLLIAANTFCMIDLALGSRGGAKL